MSDEEPEFKNGDHKVLQRLTAVEERVRARDIMAVIIWTIGFALGGIILHQNSAQLNDVAEVVKETTQRLQALEARHTAWEKDATRWGNHLDAKTLENKNDIKELRKNTSRH